LIDKKRTGATTSSTSQHDTSYYVVLHFT
jgi:hypothetical protein